MLFKPSPATLRQISSEILLYSKVIPKSNLSDTSVNRAFFRKYLKKNCFSKPQPLLFFEYLFNLCFILKLFSKLQWVENTSVNENSNHKWFGDALVMRMFYRVLEWIEP